MIREHLRNVCICICDNRAAMKSFTKVVIKHFVKFLVTHFVLCSIFVFVIKWQLHD